MKIRHIVVATGAVGLSAFGVVVVLRLLALAVSPGIPTAPDVSSPMKLAVAEDYREAETRSPPPASVVVDVDYGEGETAGWFPRGESPLLAELVAAGKLPPVGERVGSEPLVLRAPDGIGRYGGTLVTAGPTPDRLRRAAIVEFGYANLVRWGHMGYPIAPNVARDWEVNEDFTEWIIHLRKGMRWSDGHPFTADDILYWWEEEIEFFGGYPGYMLANGEPGDIERIDAHSIRITFPHPYSLFFERLMETNSFYAPRHYLERYHPERGDPAFIKAEMTRLNAVTPRSLYNSLDDFENPHHPRLTPWVVRERPRNSPFFLVRNPYFYGVDEAGNQLPYIDRIMIQVKSPQIITQSAVNGELDFQAA